MTPAEGAPQSTHSCTAEQASVAGVHSFEMKALDAEDVAEQC